MATSPIVTALFRPPGGFFVRPEFYDVQGLNRVRGSGRRAKTSLSWDFVDRVSRLPTLPDIFLSCRFVLVSFRTNFVQVSKNVSWSTLRLRRL